MNILKTRCFDGVDGFVNLRFKHNDNEYLFVEFVPKNCRLVSAFKRVLKLNDKNGALKSVLCMLLVNLIQNLKKVNKVNLSIPYYLKKIKI